MSKNKKKRKSNSPIKKRSNLGLHMITWVDDLSHLDQLLNTIKKPSKIKVQPHIIVPTRFKSEIKESLTDDSIDVVISDHKSSALAQIASRLKSKYILIKDANTILTDDILSKDLPELYTKIKQDNDLVVLNSADDKTKQLPLWLVRRESVLKTTLPSGSVENFEHALDGRLKRQSENTCVVYSDHLKENTNLINWTAKKKWTDRLDYYVNEPIRNIKNKEARSQNENPIYRLAFASLVILSFFAISIMSQSAGISGDEFRYIEQAEKVYSYFATGGSDKSAITKTSIDPQHYNGQSFDNVLYVLQKWFQFDDQFKFRHLINSWSGWLTMFVAALIAIGLGGYRAGILTLVFCFFSPRFLGHSFNNHRDIPVALAAVLTIFFAIKFFKSWPTIRWKSVAGLILSIALAYSVRFGAGILMTGIICVSAFVYWVILYAKFNIFSSSNISSGFKLAAWILGGSVLAYFLGIINWPFGLEGPISNGKEVLNATSNLGVTIRQLFEGETIFSDQIPWYYTLKYIGITVPAVIIIGGLLSLLGFKYLIPDKKFNLFVILFCLIFPLVYTSIMTKNDYGGWRHFLFTFPFLAIASSIGFTILIDQIHKPIIKKYGVILLVILLIHPIVFTIRSHPYEYVYYNELVGGINGAFGNYETDYSQNSTKGAADWLLDHADQIVPPGQKLRIGTNNYKALKHYLRHYEDKFTPVYTRYYEKSRHDWDYGAYTSTYIDGDQIKLGHWPPQKSVATIEANGVPIGAVIKRVSKEDYLAIEAMKKNDISQALTHLNNYIAVNPENEEVWVAKSRVELAANNLTAANASVDRALEIYPKFISAFDSKGRIMFASGNYPATIEYFDQALKIRESYHIAHYFKALSFLQLKKYNQAIESSDNCIKYQQKFTACYDTAADAYRAIGNEGTAQNYIQAKNKIK